jgi:CRISPR/Cas system-associated exonuclease Cas4 (RecB family)
MADWSHASASQIKTFTRCERKWWFEKIAGYTSPPSAAATLGRDLHAELEDYFLTGKELESPILKVGFDALPPRDANLLVEENIRLTEPGMAAPIVGVIDLVELDDRRITDHKTTSDFRWMRSEYQLAVDPQAIIYVMAAHRRWFSGEDTIEFRHLYYRTRGAPAAAQSSVTFNIADLTARFADIKDTVNSMEVAAAKPTASKTSPNPAACGDYGGCPFRGRCALLGTDPVVNQPSTGDKPMGLFSKLNNVTTTTTPIPTTTAALFAGINPPDGVAMDDTTVVKEEKPSRGGKKVEAVLPDGRNIRTLKKAELAEAYRIYWNELNAVQVAGWRKASRIVEEAEAFMGGEKFRAKAADIKEDLRLVSDLLKDGDPLKDFSKHGQALADYIAKHKVREVTELPNGTALASVRIKDFPLAFREVVHDTPGYLLEQFLEGDWCSKSIRAWIQEDCPPDHSFKRAEMKASLVSLLTFITNPPEAKGADDMAAPPIPTIEEPVTPVSEVLEEVRAATPAPAPEPEPEPAATRVGFEPEGAPVPKPKPKPQQQLEPQGHTLYIGCAPSVPGARRLEDLLVPYQQRVAEDAAVPHYGLIKYAEGPKRVAALVLMDVHQEKLALPSQLICQPGMPCTSAVVEALMPFYGNVVRAIGSL